MNKQDNDNNIAIGNSDYDQVLFDSKQIVNGEVHSLTSGTSGSGKSYLTRTIIESLCINKLGTIVVIDPEGEYLSLRKLFDFVILGVDKDTCDILITEENAGSLATKMLEHKINMIIDLKYTDDHNRQEIASNFINAVIDNSSPALCNSSPLQIVIDETSRFASKGVRSIANIKCTGSLKRLIQFGRMREISTFYNTQRVTQLPADITCECDTVIIGKCSNQIDIERNSRKIGLKNSSEIESLKKYEFIACGDGFVNGSFNRYVRFKSLTPKSEHGMKSSLELQFKKLPKSETVSKWIELMGVNNV